MYRAHHHNELSFGLVYAWSERFILPISHDEVVHGKHSLIDKMPGDRWQKFANLRAYLTFHVDAPGQEAAVHGLRVWPDGASGTTTSNWTGTCCNTPNTVGVQKLVSDLNRLYREEPALYEQDDAPRASSG